MNYDSEHVLGQRDIPPAKRGKGYRPEPLPAGALYAREQRFVDALLELLEGGEPLDDRTITLAGRQAFRFGSMTEASADAKALRQGNEMLSRPSVLQEFTDLFEAAGFSKADAAAAHVRHINEGNYQALRDYWKMVTPQTPKQIEMKAAHLHMTPNEFEITRTPTAMAGRIVGELPAPEETIDASFSSESTHEPARQSDAGSAEGTG